MSIRIDVRIVSDDVHTHCLALPRDLASYAAQADHAERFTRKLHSLKPAFFPLATPQSHVGLGNVASERKEHGNGVLRGCRCGAARRVHYQNSVLRGRVEINVINTYTGTTDNFQATGPLHQLAIDKRAAAHDDAIRLGHDTHQVVA